MTHFETNDARPLRPVSVRKKVAIPVPDKGLNYFAGRKLFMPIVNRKQVERRGAKGAQDFGFNLKFGRIGPV